ncbi:alpha/beta fold hydrolase [Corallococcus sp. M34]|nr:alpha/beta fold hydrolase [Citreicoccus inhibens]
MSARGGRETMNDTYLEVPAEDGSSFRAWITRPASGSGPALVLLLVEDFDGNAHLRQVAELYAEEGYVVLVPDLVGRGEPEVADIVATVNAARAMPEVVGQKGDKKVGLLGFGLGGTLACRVAASGLVDCAVAYCGIGLDDVLAEAGAGSAPMVLHFAEKDGFVPPTAVARVKERVGKDSPVELYVYPNVRHGFHRHGTAAYDRPAEMMAHSRSIALFHRVMGPNYDLGMLWEKHCEFEFGTRDADATMATMVAHPYVNSIPVMTGGVGYNHLRRFYANHFVHKNPKDTKMIPMSRTLGADRLVDEVLFCFTHDVEMDWMLPGIAPTGKYVEVPLVAIVNFRGDKLCHEHIYWDQASVLVQIGLLDPQGLPVVGGDAAKKLVDETLPSNTIMQRWDESAPHRQAG